MKSRFAAVLTLIAATASLASDAALAAPAQATPPAQPKETPAEFQKRKTEVLSNIDDAIQGLQEHRKCIDSAKDREAFAECHRKFRERNRKKQQEFMKKHPGRARHGGMPPAPGAQQPQKKGK